MTPAVYIAQLLCPQRHCVLGNAAVYESPEEADSLRDTIREAFDAAVAAKILNPWCGLCHSRDLHVEIGRTAFATMEEARPHLEAEQAAQLRTAAMLKEGRN